MQLQLFNFISHSLRKDFILGDGEMYLRKLYVNVNHDAGCVLGSFSKKDTLFSFFIQYLVITLTQSLLSTGGVPVIVCGTGSPEWGDMEKDEEQKTQ